MSHDSANPVAVHVISAEPDGRAFILIEVHDLPRLSSADRASLEYSLAWHLPELLTGYTS